MIWHRFRLFLNPDPKSAWKTIQFYKFRSWFHEFLEFWGSSPPSPQAAAINPFRALTPQREAKGIRKHLQDFSWSREERNSRVKAYLAFPIESKPLAHNSSWTVDPAGGPWGGPGGPWGNPGGLKVPVYMHRRQVHAYECMCVLHRGLAWWIVVILSDCRRSWMVTFAYGIACVRIFRTTSDDYPVWSFI